MRILIQDPVSQGYFDGISWNAGAEKARSFESVAQAEVFCQERQITRALIVVKFKNSDQEIRYPIGAKDALLVSKPPPTTRISKVA